MTKTETVASNVYAVLTEHNLHLLYTVLHTSNLYAVQKITDDIKESYKIDLSDEHVVGNLTDAQIKNLHKYEKKNSDFLAASILNEYPDTAKYIKEKTRDVNVDPLGTFQKWFAAFVMCAGFAYLGMVTFTHIPTENQRFADTITGAILTQLFQIALAYIFRNRQDGPWQQFTVGDKKKK